MPNNYHKGRNLRVFYSFVLLLIIIGIILLYLFYFTKPFEDKKGNDDIKLGFYGPSQVIAGTDVSYSIFIDNKEDCQIKDVELTVDFPENFDLNSLSPTRSEELIQGGVWQFPRLQKNEIKKIKINGKLFGIGNDSPKFHARVIFKLDGFTSQFEREKSFAIKIVSPITSHSNFDQVIPGMTSNLQISLDNVTENNLQNIKIKIKKPDTFHFSTEDKKKIDTVFELKPYEHKEISLEGYITNFDISTLNFVLQIGIINQDNFFPVTQEEKEITLKSPNFSLNSNMPHISSWGRDVPVQLSYKNDSQVSVYNFSLEVVLSGDNLVDTSKIRNTFWQYNGIQRDQWNIKRGQNSTSFLTMAWDKKIIKEFSEIKPGESRNINFSLPILSSIEAAQKNISQGEIKILINGRGQPENVDEIIDLAKYSDSIKINTDVNLKTMARYYDMEGAPIGDGPIPPEKNKTTKYWIFFNITNTTNPLKNVIVKTNLPPGVNWTGSTKCNQGLILYNDKKREVNWKITNLDSYQGGPYSLLEAGFEVSILPKENQVGMILPLTSSIILNAQDCWTNSQIVKENNFLDTNLSGDRRGQNKGYVIE